MWLSTGAGRSGKTVRRCYLLIAFSALFLMPSHLSLAQKTASVMNDRPSNPNLPPTIELKADRSEIVLSQGDITSIKTSGAKDIKITTATATATATFTNVDPNFYFVATTVKSNGEEEEVDSKYISGVNFIKHQPENHFSMIGDGNINIIAPISDDGIKTKVMHIRIRHKRQTSASLYQYPKACSACDTIIHIKKNDTPEYTLKGNKDGSLSVRAEGGAHIVKYEDGRIIAVENEGNSIPLPEGSVEIGIRHPLPSVDGRKKFQEVRVKVSAPVEADEIPQAFAASGSAALTPSFKKDVEWNTPEFGPSFSLSQKEINEIAAKIKGKKIKILMDHTVNLYKHDGNGRKIRNKGFDYSSPKCATLSGGEIISVNGVSVREKKETYWLKVALNNREKKLCRQDVAYLPICTHDQPSGVVKECGPWPWFVIQTNDPTR